MTLDDLSRLTMTWSGGFLSGNLANLNSRAQAQIVQHNVFIMYSIDGGSQQWIGKFWFHFMMSDTTHIHIMHFMAFDLGKFGQV